MTLKRLLTLFALLAVLISSVAFAAPAMAGLGEVPANEAANSTRKATLISLASRAASV